MSGSQHNVQATMEAAVEAKLQASGLNCPDRQAIEEDALYFRPLQNEHRQSFVKVIATMLTCASGGLLTSMNMFSQKQGSWLGFIADVLAIACGALVGYYTVRQKR